MSCSVIKVLLLRIERDAEIMKKEIIFLDGEAGKKRECENEERIATTMPSVLSEVEAQRSIRMPVKMCCV